MQRSYIGAVSKLSRYFGRSPDKLGLEDVRAFQAHLVSTGISWPALNQIVCTLRFFNGVTLEWRNAWRSGYSRAHPVCAGATQAARHIEPRRNRAISGRGVERKVPGGAHFTCYYAAGLRAPEVGGLMVADRQCAGRHPGTARQGATAGRPRPSR